MIKKEKVNTDENVLYIIGWILLLFLVLIAVVYKLFPTFFSEYLPPCMFLKLTGFYCPGCGGTRAILALTKGRLLTSFLYHPLVLYAMVVGGWFMISHTIERLTKGKAAIGMKYWDGYLWIALVLVIINFLVKNVLLFLGVDVLAG